MSEESLRQKQLVIDEIKEKFDRSVSAVVIDYMGITVAEADAMRRKLREAEVDYKVYKNTLVNRAIDGTDYAQLKEILAGPSAFAFGSDDATAPARVLNGVMKEYKKMAFKAGVIEGVFYDAAGMAQIAEIPSRDVLIAKFLGSIQNPVSGFVRVLAAIADKDEAAAPTEEPATADEKPAEEAAPAKEPATADEKPAEEAAPAEETATADEKPAEEAAPAEESATEDEKPAEEAAEKTEAE
ncbi:MAG: 50S ribosomal protein L10 [Clostridiales Family XIII bacterium]|jgi:large subunit ribosomal protein L10|nr:50S ribosomal protein L10 [Clostridiales Family XIII bacterium]